MLISCIYMYCIYMFNHSNIKFIDKVIHRCQITSTLISNSKEYWLFQEQEMCFIVTRKELIKWLSGWATPKNETFYSIHFRSLSAFLHLKKTQVRPQPFSVDRRWKRSFFIFKNFFCLFNCQYCKVHWDMWKVWYTGRITPVVPEDLHTWY